MVARLPSHRPLAHNLRRQRLDPGQAEPGCFVGTTEADVEKFRATGVRYLITTTPRFQGRSFGTNMMESALVAVAGKGRTLTRAELTNLIAELDMHPQIEKLN